MLRLLPLAAIAAIAAFIPAIPQNQLYHAFADSRTIFGIPNFWNVASNLPFLIVALYGLKSFRSTTAFKASWERTAYSLVLFGTAAVSFGSAYYHSHPDDDHLFWDRLPMAIVFTAIVASTVGERYRGRAGRLLLWPLLALGIASVFEWRWTGDLRLYAIVQFGAMAVAIVMVWTHPPLYTEESGIRLLGLFYVLAKLLESFDAQLGHVLATGGHPWKHLSAALAMWFYVRAIARRRPVPASQA